MKAADTRNARAAIGDGRGGFVIDDVEVRSPAAGEVRVRIAAAGLCHTDHQSLRWPGPLVLGHEGAGHVEALGDGVQGLRIGQPVLLNWAIPCGACPRCRAGQGALCERTQGVDAALGTSDAAPGHTRWRGADIGRAFRLGTLAELTVVRAEALTALPPRLSLRCACILGCGVMTGVGSVFNSAQVQPGDSVAVLGCGGVGLSVIQGARIAGAARIIAIDRRADSLARARHFGATDVVQVPDDDLHLEHSAQAVRALTHRRGADHAFEATGVHALAFAPLKLVRHGGTALQLSGAHGQVNANMLDFWWDKRYLAPLYGGCQPERDFPRLFDWAERGELELDAMITRTYALAQLGEAFDDLLAGRNVKGVILFDGDESTSLEPHP
jgi:S-(hydroxymethyl)glutathione dehydrogenase / alcohol dehydrogenase